MGPALPPPITLSQPGGRLTFTGAVVVALRTTSTGDAICLVRHSQDWRTHCHLGTKDSRPYRIEVVKHPEAHRVELIETYP